MVLHSAKPVKRFRLAKFKLLKSFLRNKSKISRGKIFWKTK